jgi:hypothetical protein
MLSLRLSTVFLVYKCTKIHKTGTVRPSFTLFSTRMPFAPWPSGVSLSCAICPRIKYITTPPEPSLGTNKRNKQIERWFHEYSQWETDFSNILGQIGDNCISTSTNDQTGMVVRHEINYTDVMTLCFRTRVPRWGPSGAGTMGGCRVGAGGTMTSNTVGTLPSADGLIRSIVAVVSSSTGTKGRRNRR